ncbi:flagellar filament capping protein FliD [Christensenella hongkongensis]|uniref:Flagellar hook-associated protein 2 n=1 Tax=Christensenella hongkongensis TaxID=270498 RepID=A0A0M2NJU3_9FIRM|nr:flagellar filament capping protein FliD [Christensenella hongkongensis]KKI50500.1 Flagellar hook-associated protein FliD [Christensenella hongkongensis]TCW29733.1 flagellar capping protein FliD [Christensenella hongkongensis]
MATNPISSYSTSRITGLISGMDTDSLIEKAMKSEQAKLDRMYQSKTKLEWKRDAYTDINTKLLEFSNKYMSQTSADNIFSTNVYKAYKISISDKYSSYFDIKGTANATISNHKITKTTLAEYATVNGAKYRNRVAGLTGTANSNSLASVSGTKKLGADWQDQKLSELTYEDGTKVFNFSSSGDKLSFSVNGQTFVFDQDEKMTDVLDSVSGNPSAKAKMSVVGGQIHFESTVKGEKTALVFANSAGPEVFGKNGAFGITDTTIKAKSLINEDMTLGEIATATGKDLGFDASGKISFEINGETFTFERSDTLKSVLQTVNDNADAKVTMTYDQEKDQFMLRSDVTGTGTEVSVSNKTGNFFGNDGLTGIKEDTTTKYQTIDRGTDTIATAAAKMGIDLQLDSEGKFSFTVNGVDFSFNTTDTLQTMINKVNGNEEAKAKLTYSQITDSFVFTSSETGRDATVTVANKDGANAFGGADSFFGTAEASSRGTDATIEIDGETITQSSNSFVLDGMEFTLKTAFDSSDPKVAELGPASFSVEQDIDKVVDKVKKFVEDYNKLVQSLYEQITEEIDYDYSPLSQSARADLSEDDLKQWDEKAKQGILRNDSVVNNLLFGMRTSLFEAVGDTGLSAHDLGISTIAYSKEKYGGQLEFDEDKFREMMKKDPDAVANVMAATSTATDSKVEHAQSGLISRFFDQLSDARSTIRSTNLKNTNQQISDTETKMSDQLKKMYEQQEALYNKFATMETLMSQYQQQSTWLTQQISSLNSQLGRS